MSSNVAGVQMRYVERAPGCADPAPVPVQHRKTQRKSAPKPGTPEEARHQAEQQKKLAQVLFLFISCHYCIAHVDNIAVKEVVKMCPRIGL